MANVVIYKQQSGVLAVVVPSPDWSVEDVALKDVPAGDPYLIVEENQLPPDTTYFAAWEADFSQPDGYGIGQQEWERLHPQPEPVWPMEEEK